MLTVLTALKRGGVVGVDGVVCGIFGQVQEPFAVAKGYSMIVPQDPSVVQREEVQASNSNRPL